MHTTTELTWEKDFSVIPNEGTLLRWKREIEKANSLAKEEFYVKTEYGLYNIDCVHLSLQIHKTIKVTECVKKELDWLSSHCLIPQSIAVTPKRENIEKIVSLIHDQPYNMLLNDYDMFPDELARLCGDRYLSGDHMLFISKLMNTLQTDFVCLYHNYKHASMSELQKNCNPNANMVAIFNVGKNARGTFIGSDENPGCHFSIAVFYKKERKVREIFLIIYCIN